MKKGTGRIIFGIILVFAQLLSMKGATKFGDPLPSIHIAGRSFAQIAYDSLACAAYYFLGILGLVLIIAGIVRLKKAPAPASTKPKDNGVTADTPKENAAIPRIKRQRCEVSRPHNFALIMLVVALVLSVSFSIFCICVPNFTPAYADLKDQYDAAQSENDALKSEIDALRIALQEDASESSQTPFDEAYAEGYDDGQEYGYHTGWAVGAWQALESHLLSINSREETGADVEEWLNWRIDVFPSELSALFNAFISQTGQELTEDAARTIDSLSS